MFEEFFIPQYDALVDDGKLINFGMLGHGWGDEWNLNYFMTAKNQDELIKAFGKGFSEAIKTMGPEKWKKMKGMIMEHKDKLYDVRHYHDKKWFNKKASHSEVFLFKETLFFYKILHLF